MLKGAEIVLRCIRGEGVDLVFGYPGGAIMPLYDAVDGSGVRHILTRHEQGAVFAAEGYARVTGKVGVAMATSGPGATNLVTGIADAKMDSVPLVCITGQVRTAMIGTDAFQETDVFGVTLSLTKWSRLVRTIASTVQRGPTGGTTAVKNATIGGASIAESVHATWRHPSKPASKCSTRASYRHHDIHVLTGLARRCAAP